MTNVVKNCENTGTVYAPNATYVGGICGYNNYGGSATYNGLVNKADVTGKEYVGGFTGKMSNAINYDYASSTINISECSNSGNVIATGDYAGGFFGYLYFDASGYKSGNAKLCMIDNANTGNVTTTGNYAGGIAGYARSDDSGSYVQGTTSSADIVGNAYVGGLFGRAEQISLENCDNSGSTVTATRYILDGTTKYVYLGGYVGYGYDISDCVNTVDISYDNTAYYVGGFAGYMTGAAKNCENSGTVYAPKATYVGGICGYNAKSGSTTFTKLVNKADVTGKTYVGGFFGRMNNTISYDYASSTIYISECNNSGNITAAEDYVGGFFGYLYFDASGYKSGNAKLSMIDNANIGNVTTSGNYAGGIAGYARSDDSGSSTQSTANSGTVTGNENVGEIFGKYENITVNE